MSIIKKVVIATSPQFRRLQVLEKLGNGDCLICKKQTEIELVYVYEEVELGIPLFIPLPGLIIGGALSTGSRKYWPSFYCMFCNECNAVLKIMPDAETVRLAKKFDWRIVRRNLVKTHEHKKGIEKKAKTLEIRFCNTVSAEVCTKCDHIKVSHFDSKGFCKEKGCNCTSFE